MKRWKRQGCYMWRTRKPHAPLGLPVLGRHTGYIGQTGSRWHRDRQHLAGSVRWGAAKQPWSDLEPKVYPLPCLFPQWRWSRELSETLWTWLLCPVYSVEKQAPWNLRRISRARAARMREARDRRRARRGWWRQKAVDILVTSARLVIVAAALVALILIFWR
jgi:hypothetical protein